MVKLLRRLLFELNVIGQQGQRQCALLHRILSDDKIRNTAPKLVQVGGDLIVRFCGRSAHNYAAFMDVPRTEWEHWANADSAIVHADFRGNGLQRLMLEAALPLFPKKITHIGATVSPQNQYSLHNALASGFAIVSRREMYGGHDRYLLARKL